MLQSDSSTHPSIHSPPQTKPPRNWAVIVALGLTFLVSVAIVPWYGFVYGYSGLAWALCIMFFFLNGIGIGSGYHRLWSHRAYEAGITLKIFLALMGAMAMQNSIVIWSARHRVHHRDVDDNDKDPYSIGRGFWFAHIGWMLKDYPSGSVDHSMVRDLAQDPIVAWQSRWYWTLVLATNVALPLLLGWMAGEIIGMFLLVGVLRLVMSHHVTFFINSLAHMWGKQPYTDENSARDSHLLAMFTHGEGYHNFHHFFQSDYRNGVRWWHIDLNKWFISACTLLGLARNRRRAPQFKILRARLSMEFKKARSKLEQIDDSTSWKSQLESEYAQFVETIKQWQKLQMERVQQGVQQGRQMLTERLEAASLMARYRELERSLRMQHKRVALLVAQVHF